MLFTLAITNSHLSINLLFNIEININNFVSRNINNYNNIRNCSITSNKNTSKIVLISLNEILMNYVTKIKQLNNISNKDKTRNPINNL